MVATLASIFVCVVAGYGIYYLNKWMNYRNIFDKLPGPVALPFIGNLLYFMGTPETTFLNIRKLIKKYGNIGRVWVSYYPIVVFADPSDVELLLSTTKHTKKSVLPYSMLQKWLGTGLLTSYGHKWETRRKILTPSFHFNILQDFLGVFVEQTEYLVKILNKETTKTSTNLVPYITQFTLHSVCETAMGTSPTELRENSEYQGAIYKMGEHIVYRFTHPWFFFDTIYAITTGFWKQRNIIKYLHNISYSVIEKRRNELLTNIPVQDLSYAKRKKMALLDVLISSKIEGAPIDNEGIREEVDTFMFEGHDTTSMSICFTLMLLANHPEIQQKIYEESIQVIGNERDHKVTFNELNQLKYLERCIKESLRLFPSVHMIGRNTTEEMTTHSGYTIPANTSVFVTIYDMHRNPKLFPDPERFDPDRFLPENCNRHPFSYIPFSAGPRNCIGQKFAMLELKTVISGIIRNYVLTPIDTPENIKIIIDLIIRPKNGIKVKFTKR